MLWKLVTCPLRATQGNSNYYKLFNQLNVIGTNICRKNDLLISIRRKCHDGYNRFSQDQKKITQFKFRRCVAFTVIGGLSGLKLANLTVADCAAKTNARNASNSKTFDEEPRFDWYKFFKMLLPEKLLLLLAVGCAVIVAVLNVQIPICLGNLVNVLAKFLQDKSSSLGAEMRGPATLFLMLSAAQSVATFAYISLLAVVGERLAARMKTSLFESIMHQDLAFFDKERTGELIDSLTSDVQEFKSAFKGCISQGLRSLTQISGCIVTIYLISPVMTGAMLCIVPSILGIGTFLGSILRSLSRAAQIQAAKATSHAEEIISNVRTVRAFASETKECEKFESKVWKSCSLYERLGFGIGMFQGATNFFLNGILFASLYFGGFLVASGKISAGDIMSFLVATQTMQKSIANMFVLSGSFIKGIQSGARVFQLINTEPSIPLNGGEKITYHSLIPEVTFTDVTFAYPTRPEQIILKNFNLTIPAGKTVAIVGSSGNGKSTVAGLLERFYDVDNGSVRVGGKDIKELDPSWLRGNVIGLINQEPVLFATSIKENIRYGKTNATDEEVYRAAKMANAHEFISKFPNGYDTVVGERGSTVSGGQKQRIAIARALIKNPSILILDEATSALDAESEKVVQNALEQVTKHRTVLVIAHRLSTIQDADTIIVLKDGIVVETGTHNKLMLQRGYYWNLMNQQTADERASG